MWLCPVHRHFVSVFLRVLSCSAMAELQLRSEDVQAIIVGRATHPEAMESVAQLVRTALNIWAIWPPEMWTPQLPQEPATIRPLSRSWALNNQSRVVSTSALFSFSLICVQVLPIPDAPHVPCVVSCHAQGEITSFGLCSTPPPPNFLGYLFIFLFLCFLLTSQVHNYNLFIYHHQSWFVLSCTSLLFLFMGIWFPLHGWSPHGNTLLALNVIYCITPLQRVLNQQPSVGFPPNPNSFTGCFQSALYVTLPFTFFFFCTSQPIPITPRSRWAPFITPRS